MSKDGDGDGDGDGVEFEGSLCTGETPKALFVKLDDGRVITVPKSVIHDDSEVFDEGDNRFGKLVIKQWFADKEGLT